MPATLDVALQMGDYIYCPNVLKKKKGQGHGKGTSSMPCIIIESSPPTHTHTRMYSYIYIYVFQYRYIYVYIHMYTDGEEHSDGMAPSVSSRPVSTDWQAEDNSVLLEFDTISQ